MPRPSHRLLLPGFAAACLALALCGCAHTFDKLVPNQRPSVEFTQAPVSADPADRGFYAYRVFWSGNDPDGRVDHFEYSIDPRPGDTLWVQTRRSEEVLFFTAPVPDSIPGPLPIATGFHVLVLRAVDDRGAPSARVTRAFYSWTVAPSVNIDSPKPLGLLDAQVAPSVVIHWSGSDPDGQRSQKPVRYKFKRIALNKDTEWILSHPDSLRRSAAATGFAGWDSTGAESTFVRYENMSPKDRFVFVVIAIDEAGAYSPIFSLDSNILRMSVTIASQIGPRIHVFNALLDFTYDSGGYSADPLRWIRLEAAFGSTLRFNWDAIPAAGAIIQHFRWGVDLQDLQDNTPRRDEELDILHWSRKSPLTTSCTLTGLSAGQHLLYIEAMDNNGFASLAVVALSLVTTPFDKDVLIVDDTRREVDKFLPSGCPETYKDFWPSHTELDTFLFARGGVRWRCTQSPDSGVLSPPGLFAGYAFETLNTRQGLEVPTRGASLKVLGQYRHIVWLVDAKGSANPITELQGANPVTALRFMSSRGQASTLGAYVLAGGRVWLCGGGAATAATDEFNSPRNDRAFGRVYSNSGNELISGRVMFDGAHWQSAFTTDAKIVRFTRSPRAEAIAAAPWTHPDHWTGEDLHAPDYLRLPAELRVRDPALDPLPPTRRAGQSLLYYRANIACEYLIEPNLILEDVDPSPDSVHMASVCDTLYNANSSQLVVSPAPTMTWYHGSEANRFVFSGFAPWDIHREDGIALTDFVLQDLWGLKRRPVDRGPAAGVTGRPAGRPTLVTPAQRSLHVGVRRE